MTCKLTPIESLRICGLLEESIDKLSLLGSLAPDSLQQLVGEKPTCIIQNKRELSEKLVSQRAVLKGLSTKSKLKGNQHETQEMSRLARPSTKTLCRRNLKENPNLPESRQEREGLLELLGQTLAEIKQHGTFITLLTYVAEGTSTHEKTHDILKTEREAVDEVKKLEEELAHEKMEHEKEVVEHKTAILRLKEQIVAAKAKAKIDLQFARNEAKAKQSSAARMYLQLMDEQRDRIKTLQEKCSTENKVHDETVRFLIARHNQLETELVEWNRKYEQDTQAKQTQLGDVQERKAANAQRLEVLKQKWLEEMTLIQEKEQERQRLLALEILREEEMKVNNKAARIIQLAYLAHIARKAARRKKPGSKKKVGKKKQGGLKKGKK